MKRIENTRKMALDAYQFYCDASIGWDLTRNKYEKACKAIVNKFLKDNLPKGSDILISFSGGCATKEWKEYAFFSRITDSKKHWEPLDKETWLLWDYSLPIEYGKGDRIPTQVKDGPIPMAKLRAKMKELSGILGFEVGIYIRGKTDLQAVKMLDGTVYHKDNIKIDGDFYRYEERDGYEDEEN